MKYVVETRQIVTRTYEYEFELELPIEDRVADKIVVQSARTGRLSLGEKLEEVGQDETVEKVTRVSREGTQVYPRVRKPAATLKKPLPLTQVEDE